MNRVIIDLSALEHNIRCVDGWMKDHGATWTLVTKVLCGNHDTLSALQALGVRSVADSRLSNLEAIKSAIPECESWYLRLPHTAAIPKVIRFSDVSLNSELETLNALNQEAKEQKKLHRIIIMIELGDLREGILPGTLVEVYKRVFQYENIEILGIGANLGCLSGAVPNIDHLTQLVLYHELLELKFKRKLPLISAGTSVILPLLLDGQVPKGVNHFRIGESVFLGTNLITGETLPGLRDDALTIEAEVVEIKEKNLVHVGESSSTVSTFQSIATDEHSPGQRGYRAILTLGHLDTSIEGLTPLNKNYQIAGASSDLMVLNVGEDPGDLKIGDSIQFRPNYSAMLRAMVGKYIEKSIQPEIRSFRKDIKKQDRVEIPHVILSNSFEESRFLGN